MKKDCYELWAKNKYYVLSKSHKIYLDIREYIKNDDVNFEVLKEKISKVEPIKDSKKDFENAILHIWGYFKKDASKNEKEELFSLIEDYKLDKTTQIDIVKYINILLVKYPNEYLENSRLLSGEDNEIMA
ncbi:MAG: YbgA family protein [Clostridiaceae bacterium]